MSVGKPEPPEGNLGVKFLGSVEQWLVMSHTIQSESDCLVRWKCSKVAWPIVPNKSIETVIAAEIRNLRE